MLSQTLTLPLNAGGNATPTQYYQYDGANRLTQVAENPSNPANPACQDSASQWCEKFSFDIFGNRLITARTNVGVALTEPTSYSAATNRITTAGWSYETRGNISVDPGPGNYAYNAENRLTHYSGLSGATDYTYDGDGLRVKKVSGATTTVFVYDVAGELAAEYTTPAPALSGRRFLSVDHLGSTRLITDAGGAVVERHDYRPFGDEVTFTAGQVRANVAGYGVDQATRVKFTGKERDVESGLDYFGARYLSSVQGRFVIPDLTLSSGHPDDPQSWNRYPYVNNNPLGLVDPDGNQALEPNLQKMLQSLRAPITKTGGVAKGGLIQYVGQHATNFMLGEIFGYNPRAVKGDLSMNEYHQLEKASSYEKGALMLGVGRKNAQGIDAVDLDNGKGVSLKSVSRGDNVQGAALGAEDSAAKAGFNRVNVYIFAPTATKDDVSGLGGIQEMLGRGRIEKVVIFTKQGAYVYTPTKEQQQMLDGSGSAGSCVAGGCMKPVPLQKK